MRNAPILYRDLHLFIDETGDIAGDKHDPLRAVGGVLCFGDYDASYDQFLREILTRNLKNIAGKFPQDLHFSQSALEYAQLDDFARAVGQELVAWQTDQPHLYGVVMLHHEDIWGAHLHSTFAEDSRDNRYQAMLWALIEALVFLDPKITERLAPRWTLHLHVASRQVPFRGSGEERAMLASRGFEFDKRDGVHFMVRPLNARDLHQQFELSMRQRWKTPHVELGQVEVESIEYNDATRPSAAALYLADLYLGQFRGAKLRKQPLNILHTYRRFEYGPWHEQLVDMHLAAANGEIQRFLSHRRAFGSHDLDKDSRYHTLASQLAAKIKPEVAARPELLFAELEAASAQVDVPGQSTAGSRRATETIELWKACGEVPLRAEILYLQTQLSHANHTGDIHLSDQLWQHFLALEQRFDELGLDGLRLRAELRNRRAVSLTDHFRLDEARDTLMSLIDAQETLADFIARFHPQREDSAPNPTLGALFGTLGQVEAFSKEYSAAESFFREALQYFDHPRDIERQWVYLGHVACDTGNRDLWQEVAAALSQQGSLSAAIESGNQYLFALILKAHLALYDAAEYQNLLDHFSAERALADFSAEDRRHHPFGLIYQLYGMLYEALASAEDIQQGDRNFHAKQALNWYGEAARQMTTNSGALLNLLGLGATLRRELFHADLSVANTQQPDGIRVAFIRFRNHLQEHFGDHAWRELQGGKASGFFGRLDPGPEHNFSTRARAVLDGIRFNYW